MFQTGATSQGSLEVNFPACHPVLLLFSLSLMKDNLFLLAYVQDARDEL